jgi:hypothetical protein
MAPRILLAALAMAFVFARRSCNCHHGQAIKPTDVAFCRRPILRGDKD